MGIGLGGGLLLDRLPLMPTLDFADISGWTAFGVLAMLVLTAVMTGRLVPRRTHQDTIEERNLWREVATTKLDGPLSDLTDQLREARVGIRAQTSILHSLPRVSDEATE